MGGSAAESSSSGRGHRSARRFVWARCADGGIYAPTATHCQTYVKDLPLAKAIADEVLLAFELNGQPLREAHGAPLRLVVPGYYATNSVKWFTEIRLEQAHSESYFPRRSTTIALM
ncbi:molybdopterin-dependent oxidoreductase-like protein [Pseudorhodoplanes sinuspersici]|uniref:Uncharacterized protein n=1 Tax=Pseudorhodoplanes sinuspersici TaxID=1235591 RepID=A0A1W6ZLA2_9HYPH|nr:hypothetical protein CAK95_01505 [Pseudorhodoplanes sinuspersici]RKE68361.1 molybdopterin-dependent oxidoreductase-like protein [Pseudorhodoplanes sinuspersici]